MRLWPMAATIPLFSQSESRICGLYRELFRDKGVRFIAVNDNVDSESGEDDFTPFREILNEFYVRDCSRKVKSTYRAKGLSGKPVGSHAVYGYKKSETDKNAGRIEDFLKLTRRYRDFSELTVPMLNEFIERIVVHKRGDKWCRHTEQRIDIYLNLYKTITTVCK